MSESLEQPSTTDTVSVEAVDWNAFCDQGDGRYSLGSPFVVDGWKYATDGRIAIRQATTEPNTVIEGRFPPMADLFNRLTPGSDDFLSVIDFDTSCGECNDTGLRPMVGCGKCKDGEFGQCNGTGEVECYHCQHDMDCEECEGTGKCHSCKGLGDPNADPGEVKKVPCEACYDVKNAINALGIWAARGYFRSLKSLPGATVRASSQGKSRCFKIVANDGVTGVLMEMVKH